MRTKSLLIAVTLALSTSLLALAEPATYKVIGPHSVVSFNIRHFVSEVDGRFGSFEGSIKYDSANPASDAVAFTVKAASITTDNEARDEHLRSPDFFDAEKFPALSFTSTSVTKKDDKTLNVTGDFTLHGTTKRLTIPVTVMGTIKPPQGPEKAGFRTSFTINRMDYGIRWNKVLDGGGAMLGDDVNITIKVESDRQ